jgi:hypothetical protein
LDSLLLHIQCRSTSTAGLVANGYPVRAVRPSVPRISPSSILQSTNNRYKYRKTRTREGSCPPKANKKSGYRELHSASESWHSETLRIERWVMYGYVALERGLTSSLVSTRPLGGRNERAVNGRMEVRQACRAKLMHIMLLLQ